MKVIIQRVSCASVKINDITKGSINDGLLLFLGIAPEDDESEALWLAKKICSLRIFEDINGKMNLSIKETKGDILLISQFTLFASTKKGNRPSFNGSADPDKAIPLYNRFHNLLENELNKKIATGEFGANMDVLLTNKGPVTISINSKERT